MILNSAEKEFLESLQDQVMTKDQADAFLDLDSAYRSATIADLKTNLGLRLTSYCDGRFVQLEDKYIKFEELLLWLISIGYLDLGIGTDKLPDTNLPQA